MTTVQRNDYHYAQPCDHCGETIAVPRLEHYDRNRNHSCDDGHYCSIECYDEATGAGDYR